MNVKQEKLDVFLLTKPPFSPRSDLCLKLAARSGNAKIYLAGDGVYHLLAGIEELPGCKVFACQEDLEARAIRSKEEAKDKEIIAGSGKLLRCSFRGFNGTLRACIYILKNY